MSAIATNPPSADPTDKLAAEIAERLQEMDELQPGAGTKLIIRLASIAKVDRGALDLVLSVLHGDTSCLTDSYSVRAEATGRKKQTIFCRVVKQIESVRAFFPDVADELDRVRLSVMHHEDPIEQSQLVREGCE